MKKHLLGMDFKIRACIRGKAAIELGEFFCFWSWSRTIEMVAFLCNVKILQSKE